MGIRSRSASFLTTLRWQIPLLAFLGAFWLLAVDRFILPMMLLDIDREVFRDSAVALAPEYLRLRSSGNAPQESIVALQLEAARFLPEPAVFRFDVQGRLREFAGNCTPVRDALPEDVFRGISGPLITLAERREFSLCKEGQYVLSVYPYQGEADSGILLLSSARPPFQSREFALFSSLPMMGTGIAMLILLALWSRWIFQAFRKNFMTNLQGLNEQANRFVRGDYSASFAGGEFQEIEEIAQSFNELARMNEERIKTLEEDNRERRELLAGFAHDLRTPMTAMEGSVHLLANEGLQESQRQRFSFILRENLDSQRKLLDHLSTLKELEDPRQEFPLESIHLGELLQTVRSLVEPTAQLRGVGIETKLLAQVDRVEAHSVSLQRALLNLLENAIRATPEGGQVELIVEQAQGRISFLLRNPYLSGEKQSPAQGGLDQGPLKLRRKTGIGLGIVKRVASLHEGGLDFDQSTAGITSVTFWIASRLKSPLLSAKTFTRTSPQEITEVSRQLGRTPRILLEFLGGLAGISGCFLITGTSPKLLWISSVVLYGLGSFFSKRSKSNSALLSSGLRVAAFLVALASLSQSNFGGVRFFQGWYFAATICVFAFAARRTLGAKLLFVLLLLLPYGMVGIPGLLSVGEIFGLLTSGFIVGLSDRQIARRTRVWFSSLFFFALFFGMGTLGGANYFAFRHVVSEASLQHGENLQRAFQGAHFADRLKVEEALLAAWRLVPLVDFVFLDQQGEDDQVVGSSRGGRPRPGFQKRDLPLPLKCSEESCPEVHILTPGRLLNDVYHRAGSGWLVDIVLLQIIGVMLIVSAFSRSWASLLNHQLVRIRSGIAEFQRGNHQARIGLGEMEEGHVLSKSLESLAERCHQVESYIQQKRSEFAEFLSTSHLALRASHAEVSAALSEPQVTLPKAVLNLRICVEAVFELALVQRADAELGEEFSLSDLLSEELESLKAQAGKEEIFQTMFEPGLMTVTAPVEFVLFAVRYILKKIIHNSKAASCRVLNLRRSEGMTVAEFAFFTDENHAVIEPNTPSLDALIWTYLQKQFVRFNAEIHLSKRDDGASVFQLKFRH